MQILQVKSELWPAHGHYRSGLASAMSVLALQIEIMNQPGNMLDAEKGQYFFRDSAIPLVRPATYSAWLHLCGLGRGDADALHHLDDSVFYTPFLPSIREEDEGGITSHMRGRTSEVHLPTLSRKSKLHLRDSRGSIQWGSVYLGNVSDSEYPLYAKLGRSDVPESFIVPRKVQVNGLDARTQGGLRSRMEFLAQYGIPAIYNSSIPLSPIRRVLFQVTSLESATAWARSYVATAHAVRLDSRLPEADYAEFIHRLIESKRKPADTLKEDLGITRTVKVGGKSTKVKLKLADLDLTL